jgi:glutamate 5-kinase
MSAKVVVIKIGSNIITKKGFGINGRVLSRIVGAVSEVKSLGFKPVIVSSGAIACGLQLLGLKSRPKDMPTLQAAASVGQSRLVESYASRFKKRGINVGQVLLTRSDFLSRQSHINATRTINRLIELDCIPVINENDAVAVEEIKFGDNDTLAALVAAALSARSLILLTSTDGLLKDPSDPNTLLRFLNEIDDEVLKLARPEKTDFGSGGMITKLKAAQIASCAGVETVITSGFEPERIIDYLRENEFPGTVIRPKKTVTGKKHWIAFVLEPKGKIVIDQGAVDALIERNKSLLPAGIKDVTGRFKAGDAVLIVDDRGNEVAKGISEMSAEELSKVKGLSTAEVREILGFNAPEEAVHRDKLVIMKKIRGGFNDVC